jgi:lysyl-tRNA synthetase class II
MDNTIINHKILAEIRKQLFDDGFIEVNTPIIREIDSPINPRYSLVQGGYLRDSMGMYLRRKMSDTIPRVFEIGPCFRKEKKLSEIHFNEFRIAVILVKDAVVDDMMKLSKDLVYNCLPFICKSETVSVSNYMSNDLQIDVRVASTDILVKTVKEKYPETVNSLELPHLIVDCYIDKYIEPSLSEKDCLYFLKEYPICTIAGAKRVDNTSLIERFECFVNGVEIIHSYEDCMDADEIKERRFKALGYVDEEFKILSSFVRDGLVPPTAIMGVGVDRLCYLCYKYNIDNPHQ